MLEIYNKNFIVDILENRLLEFFDNYTIQKQVNNIFIQNLYKYIRLNTWSGEHDYLLQELTKFCSINNITVQENIDKKTYVLTKDEGFTSELKKKINFIIKDYYNYEYKIDSINRMEIQVNFGWLPPNTSSWLNLINESSFYDYYIDGITLRPNTYKTLDGKPNSGYVCFLIKDIQQFDTIMFLYNKEILNKKFNITIASLLNEIEGSRGATLNRLVEFEIDNCFYEVGPYNRNYLTAQQASVVIQIPYEYADYKLFKLFDVTNSVTINNTNNVDENNVANYHVTFNNPNFDKLFTKYKLKNIDILAETIIENSEELDINLIQLLLGDFIWRTSDSKLIAFAQNLINVLVPDAKLIPNGVWDDNLSDIISNYKSKINNTGFFNDDIIDKNTENTMLSIYKNMTNLNPNETLFNEW